MVAVPSQRGGSIYAAKIAVAIVVFLGIVATFFVDRHLAMLDGNGDLYGAFPAAMAVLGGAAFAFFLVASADVGPEQLVLMTLLVLGCACVGGLGVLTDSSIAVLDVNDPSTAWAWTCVRSAGWTAAISSGVLLWHYDQLRKERTKRDASRDVPKSG